MIISGVKSATASDSRLKIHIESTLPTIAALCVEDSVAPPCFSIVIAVQLIMNMTRFQESNAARKRKGIQPSRKDVTIEGILGVRMVFL
ncbi:hypothetical protein J6590_069431 [Homalodisca vitripennis]|nr:hypothetical protein J6590_069431 [Homalodisca vitripennis]